MASVTVAFSPITTAVSAPSSSVSDRRISVRLPGFRGLKSKSTSASVVPLFRSVIREPLIRGRGGRVVCEAQETAFDVCLSSRRHFEDFSRKSWPLLTIAIDWLILLSTPSMVYLSKQK
ncbi:hypothetical protein ES319_D05G398300v1 [Gossypium barbadense]|uniref:Uncharacterized protein n=1 Tax=Gossypium barbadense TaxID=3634 RepID=A0A5J5RN97_GOSBA|nr:hypothetical protein ES319_D05G398300v1 [Gossypium barbadense]